MKSPTPDDLRLRTQDVVEFVLRYRRGRAFREFSEFDIAAEFHKHHFIIAGQRGKIHAIATGDINGRRVYVRQVLTTRSQDLALLARMAMKSWPYLKDIAFKRRGKERLFDFQRFMLRLQKERLTDG